MRTGSRPQSDAPRRMGDLACLPVFFNLTGKRVLVAGGSDAAAWKAELLAAAGAKVHVYAPLETCEETINALAQSGTVILHDCGWEYADWRGLQLAVGDCDEKEAPVFVARARAEGVPVNVIDKPDFCQFQYGAIVNRSPLVIGISTNGAAPILGQAVRRRIETLLPDTLAAWAGLAQSVRAYVTEALAPGAERRAFWERLADAAFQARPDTVNIADWIADAQCAPQGGVTIIETLTGEADLLTIREMRALQSADAILFDRTIPAAMLELARREARRIPIESQARGGEMPVPHQYRGKKIVVLKSATVSAEKPQTAIHLQH